MAERAPAFRHAFEAAAVLGLYGVFRLLPVDAASALGGWLARLVGPRLPVARRAEQNLRLALPQLDDHAVAATLRGMWDNLGRVVGEYPHLGRFDPREGGGRLELVGVENVDRLRDDGIGGIFVSAHLGNWEIAAIGASSRGLTLTQVYRSANNRYVDRLVARARVPVGGRRLAKGAVGTRELVIALRRGDHLGMLVDQKLNEGLAVPFFGRAAMTTTAPAELALRYRVPVVPARVERLSGARFRLVILPPLPLPDSGDRVADITEATRQINALFEDWIRDRPEQWFWLHRRWPD